MKDVNMDPANLWQEEAYTDRKLGTIRRLSPVRSDGSPDASRKPVFVGETALMTPGGSLPLSFEIPASNLHEAAALYGNALQKAFAQAMEEVQKMRRQSASQIVIPNAGAAAALSGGGPLPGNGKIHLR